MIRELFAANRRPNRIHASWMMTSEESAFVDSLRDTDASTAIAVELVDADAALARYIGWLTFGVLDDAELAAVAGSLTGMHDVDARIVAGLFLIGAAPRASWLRSCIADILRASADASRNMGPTIEVLQNYVAEPERFEPGGAVAAGTRLFEAGEFFEAHEVWEDVWRVVRDARDFHFFQGLINVAVGLKKLREGNANGLVRLMRRAGNLLGEVPDAWRGINVARLVEWVHGLEVGAEAWRDGQGDPPVVESPQLPRV